MKAIVASKNPGKIEGAKRALEKFFDNIEVIGISVSSDVSEQPVNEEVYAGAKNRVKNLKQYCEQNGISADFFMSIESGIHNLLGNWLISNIAVIEDNKGNESWSTSASFPVPHTYVEEIISTDLSKVMDKVFEKDEDRHNHGGGIQLLTKGLVSRIDLTETAFVMALTKFVNPQWN